MEVEVEYAYEAEQSDELSIKVGDIIKNVTMSEGGWWEGELNGKKGMFPDNFVKVIKKDEGKKKDVQATKRQSVKDLANKLKGQVHEGGPPVLRRKEPPAKKKRAKVVYSYEPENEDELKLDVGDTLDIIKQEEEGWWEGILNGKQGMFPSNFVEVVDESETAENTDKIENTEEHLIKGKKIQGVGLGNIFGDGPIKLRSTGGKKPVDKPQEPPKAERREDPVQRRLKGRGAVPEDINIDSFPQIQSKNTSTQSRPHSAQNIVKKHPSFSEDVDYIDTCTDMAYIDNAELHVLNMLDEKSDKCKAVLEEDLIEYEDVDITPGDFECIDHETIEIKPVYQEVDDDSSSDSCADIDYNNNRDTKVQVLSSLKSKAHKKEEKWNSVLDKSDHWKKPSGSDYSESLQTILDDLDVCLDKSCGNSEDELVTEGVEADKETGDSIAFFVPEEENIEECAMEVVPETPRDYEKRLQSLNCWNHTMLTPPERISFCKAIDSVLVTKKRFIDSAEKKPNQTPLHHQTYQDYGHFENAARALNYAAGDLGASGFMKFSTVRDENGSTVIVAKPLDAHNKSSVSTESDSPFLLSCKDQKVSNPNSPKTYFASLNKSGNLSPFIRSIADKYKLFQQPKPHFKEFSISEFQKEDDLDESYTMNLLSHQPEFSCAVSKSKSDISVSNTGNLADPSVNQMVNNYVYDVITSGHADTVSNDVDVEEECVVSNLNKQEDDVSMAVCVDENSVRIVYSKEDIDDNTVEETESSTLLSMTEGCDRLLLEPCKAPVYNWQSTPFKGEDTEYMPDVYPEESKINKEHDMSLPPIQVEVHSPENQTSSRIPRKLFQKFKSHSYLTHKLPDSGNVRQTSSYCRIPFSSNAPPFWFSKDFAESPKSKPGGLIRLRSPKRTSSEISDPVLPLFDIAERSHLDEFRAKIEAFKADNLDSFSMSPCFFDNKSPAKKRRKRSSFQAISDYNTRHTYLAQNTNWNALTLLTSDDTYGSIETFFPSRCDYPDGNTSLSLGTTDIVASPGNLDLQQPRSSIDEDEKEECDTSFSSLGVRPLTYAPKGGRSVKGQFYVPLDKDRPSLFSDLTSCTEKRKTGFFAKNFSENASENPVKLLKFHKLDEEFIPLTLPEEDRNTITKEEKCAKRSKKDNDIFSAFDKYTKTTLQCEEKHIDKSIHKTKSDIEAEKFDKSDIESEENAVSVYFKYSDEETNIGCYKDKLSTGSQKQLVKDINKNELVMNQVEDFLPETEIVNSTVSSYFGYRSEPDECTLQNKRDSPVKVSRKLLLLSSLGIRNKDDEVRKAVNEHLKATDNVIKGDSDVTAIIESRNNLYDVISEAVQSCSEIAQGNANDTAMTAKEAEEYCTRGVEQEDSRIEDRYDVTPDVDALVNDLQGLDLSDTPKYANDEVDDNEMHAFLREALGSLDDIMTESFTSVGSQVENESKLKRDKYVEAPSEVDDTVEIQNDSVLNVVGNKCILHESEEILSENIVQEDGSDVCIEVCNDPVLTVIGKKCIIHEVNQSLEQHLDANDGPSATRVLKREHKTDFIPDMCDFVSSHVEDTRMDDRLVDIDGNIAEDSFDRSLMDKATQSSPQEKDCSTQTFVDSTAQTTVETETQTELDENIGESLIVQESSLSSKDGCSLTMDYDEAYDVDGNQIDDCNAAVALASCIVYERQPTYICASPLVGYYKTESLLKDEDIDDDDDFDIVGSDNESYSNYDEQEEKPLCESSPLVEINCKDQPGQPLDYYYTESFFGNPDINFELISSSYLEDSEGELDRTRGSSLDVDLIAERTESVQMVKEREQKQENEDDDYYVDDIQARMQDSETKPTEKAVVRYSYAAENEDELTLNEGEIINILEKELEDSGWWKGELNGKTGVFPDNFVELLKEEPNKGPQPLITPAPQPKPKKPPPPAQAPVTKSAPKLPDKAPVTEPAKEEKPVTQPAIATKKPVHPPPPLSKKPIKPVDVVNKEEKKEESKTEAAHGFEAVETPADKLTHLTASRPRGPAKRPPSQVFVQNEEERNGDVKDQHWIKEEKPHVGHSHPATHHHPPKPDKSEEVPGKPHSLPARPQEPSPATASLQLAIDELRKEMHDLKVNAVSKTVFNELKTENERLKQELDSVKSTYSRRMREIMTEVDEEKKIRLSTQVEIERIRKLVAESHV